MSSTNTGWRSFCSANNLGDQTVSKVHLKVLECLVLYIIIMSVFYCIARDTTESTTDLASQILQGLMKIIVHRIYPINLGQNSAYISAAIAYADEDHVVVTNKGNQTSVYKQRVSADKENINSGNLSGTNPKMYLGKNFKGQLRDVRYYTKIVYGGS